MHALRFDEASHPTTLRLGSFHDPGLRHHVLHHHHVINMFASLVLEFETLAGGEYLLLGCCRVFFLQFFEMTVENGRLGVFFVCLFLTAHLDTLGGQSFIDAQKGKDRVEKFLWLNLQTHHQQ